MLGARSFGLYGVVFLVFMTTLGVSRALVGQPLLVRPKEAQERPGDAIGTCLVLGLGLGVAVAMCGAIVWAWDRELGIALLLFAACTPFINLQDFGQYHTFAIHRPGRAILLDVYWLALAGAGAGALFATGAKSLPWFILIWAGSGAVSGLPVLWLCRGSRFRLGLGWLRETWSFSWRYALSFASSQGAVLAASFTIIAMLGPTALGAVRGTLLLYGPMLQFQVAAIAACVAEVSRLSVGSPEVSKHVNRTTVLTTALAAVNLAVLLVLPGHLGRLVLGDTWAECSALLLPAGIQKVLLSFNSGARAGLLGLRAVRKSLRFDIVGTVMTLSFTITGAAIGGLVTAFWFLVAEQFLESALWWIVYLDHVRRGSPGDDVVPEVPGGWQPGPQPAPVPASPLAAPRWQSSPAADIPSSERRRCANSGAIPPYDQPAWIDRGYVDVGDGGHRSRAPR